MHVDGLNPELLLNREATLSITRELLFDRYPDSYFEGPIFSKETQDGLKRITSILKWLWENNVNIIFSHSESSIEKIFLNMFNLYCIEARFDLIVFTLPLRSISQDVAAHIQNFRVSMDMWKKFQKETHIEEPEVFLNYIHKMGLQEESQRIIRHHVQVECLVFDYYHISLQSTIDEFQLQGKNIRPNIFIWVPAKPDFKLIVECDEFRDHSNRQSFTADRATDRTLWGRGFQVLRFSDDEINNDCAAKAKELRDYLLSRYHEQLFKDDEEIPDYFRKPE